MRTVLIAVSLVGSLTAAEPTVGVWNGMLVVTAPATGAGQIPGATQRITVDWKDQSLEDVAAFLRATTRLNVIVLPGVEDRRVTLTVRDMPLGSLLTWICRQADVHHGYLNEALTFSAQPLRGAETMRMYDVTDITRPVQDFPGPDMAISTGDARGAIIGPMHEPTSTGGQDVDELADFIRRQLLTN
jgi:hypothetical protein